ncbi:MAG TPA: cupin domain-containing protein [Chloroflexota bacterium]|nr:cupin domain-containing protein [Chloroflexota bacterium]
MTAHPTAPAGGTFQMAPYGVTLAQRLLVHELKEFRAEKRVRKKLFEGAQLWCEMVCYEPGQGTPLHHHPREDELFVVIEGRGVITAGDQQFEAVPGALITVPATVPHDLRNTGDERLVVVFVKLSRAYKA